MSDDKITLMSDGNDTQVPQHDNIESRLLSLGEEIMMAGFDMILRSKGGKGVKKVTESQQMAQELRVKQFKILQNTYAAMQKIKGKPVSKKSSDEEDEDVDPSDLLGNIKKRKGSMSAIVRDLPPVKESNG